MSVIVPVRNEVANLPRLIEAIEAQTWPPAEVIIADGGSRDGTTEWLARAALHRDWLVTIANPATTIPAALNRCIERATQPYVARMDAHATYEPEYLERIVALLAQRSDVAAVGGMMETCGEGRWGRATAAVLRHPIAMGGAPHRVGGSGGEVDHTFCPTYRRAAVRAVGGFDEAMRVNEDYELDVRLRAAGGVIWLLPEARCTWYVRESACGLVTQMYRYGHYRSRTLLLHPQSLRARQLAPPALLISIGACTLLRPRWGHRVMLAYLVSAAAMGARIGVSDRVSPWRTATVLPLIHTAWGTGLLTGLVRHGIMRRRRPVAASRTRPPRRVSSRNGSHPVATP